jgi:CHAD domain-containing protein
VARARPVPDLQPDRPFATAAARVVTVRADELIEHSQDVLDLDDIEHVHDMRVATRRLRAVIEVFAPCFPKKKRRAVIAELNELADALGERRDRDVQIEALNRFAAELDEDERTSVQRLIDSLEAQRPAANLQLAPLVTPQRLAELATRLAGLAAAADKKGAKA